MSQEAPQGATVLDWGLGLGPEGGRALARRLGGRVLGLERGSGLDGLRAKGLARGSLQVLVASRILEAAREEDLPAICDELMRVLAPDGLLVFEESVGGEPGPGRQARASDAYQALFPHFELRAERTVLPDGRALVGLLHGRRAPVRRAFIVDADDFCQDQSGLEVLFEIKGAVPGFKINLFTIPGRCSERFLRGVRELDWVDLIPHGWRHDTPLECRDWTYEESREYLARIEPLGLTRGFKAPGWQISDGMYRALAEAGYWVADRRHNDARRPKGLRAYLFEVRDGTPYPERKHYHVPDACGNGLRERLNEVLSLQGEFRFIKDVLGEPAAEESLA